MCHVLAEESASKEENTKKRSDKFRCKVETEPEGTIEAAGAENAGTLTWDALSGSPRAQRQQGCWRPRARAELSNLSEVRRARAPARSAKGKTGDNGYLKITVFVVVFFHMFDLK